MNNGDLHRNLLLSLIASLTFADHMGDVGNCIEVVLGRLGLNIQFDELYELRKELGKRGVKTLYGTEIQSD